MEKDNNFDLVRIFLTLQVVYHHFYDHLHPNFSSIGRFFYNAYQFFPSLPVFFLISGFLVSMSFERADSVRHYFMNRILKLYPALWGFYLIALLCVALTGYFQTNEVTFVSLLTWLLAQVSFLQVYNPNFMRNFGVGVLNGSLWTLTAEIQFYLVLPILYNFLKKRGVVSSNVLLVLLIILFSFVSIMYTPPNERSIGLVIKIYWTSFIPYFYMLLIGILIQRNFMFLKKFIEGKALIWLGIYSVSYVVLGGLNATSSIYMRSNTVQSILLFVILSFMVFSFVFSCKKLSRRIFRGNDITYGTYIYHMLIINLFVQYSVPGNLNSMCVLYIISCGLAYLSWRFIEKPALKLKKRKFNTATSDNVKSISTLHDPIIDN